VNEEVAGKGGSRDQGNRRLEELASWGWDCGTTEYVNRINRFVSRAWVDLEVARLGQVNTAKELSVQDEIFR
jgi:hypothetical protein